MIMTKTILKLNLIPDHNLPLSKRIEIPVITIVARATFYENNKYYPQVSLDECLYKIQKCYIMIKLMFWKEVMLVKQVHQGSLIFVTISIF